MHSTGNYQQNEKTTYRIGENICKWCDLQGVNIQNIQSAPTTQYQKKIVKIKDIRPEYTFSKENIQIANSLVKRCSTSLIIKEMEIKTMRYHFTHVRMTTIKKSTNNKRCRGYR